MEYQSNEHINETTKENNITFAGFWIRIFALIIDVLVLGIFGIIIGGIFQEWLIKAGAWGKLIGFTITTIYFSILNSNIGKGQTLGKMLLKLKITDYNGNLISFPKSLLRSVIITIPWFLNGALLPNSLLQSPAGYLINLVLFGTGSTIIYLYIFNRKTRQSLHDLLAKTLVVKEKNNFSNIVPALWRVHKIMIIFLFTATLLANYITKNISTQNETISNLMEIQNQLIENEKNPFIYVMKGFSQNFNNRTDYIQVKIIQNNQTIDNEELAIRSASVVMEKYTNINDINSIVIVLMSGYDIGIARSWKNESFAFPPNEWSKKISGQRI